MTQAEIWDSGEGPAPAGPKWVREGDTKYVEFPDGSRSRYVLKILKDQPISHGTPIGPPEPIPRCWPEGRPWLPTD